jgi:hypothetical protein
MESPWIEMGCWIGHGGRATFGVSWQAVKGGGGGGDEDKDGEGRLVVGRAVSGGGDGRIVLWEVVSLYYGKIAGVYVANIPALPFIVLPPLIVKK